MGWIELAQQRPTNKAWPESREHHDQSVRLSLSVESVNHSIIFFFKTNQQTIFSAIAYRPKNLHDMVVDVDEAEAQVDGLTELKSCAIHCLI